MRIGILSDTHMRRAAGKLPEAVIQGLSGVDLILHAGDWTSPEVIEWVKEIAPVESVLGNNDGPDIAEYFGRTKIVSAGGKRIGLVHGDRGPGKSTEQRALLTFRDEQPDIIVFGHSHIPHHEYVDGILLFNPGSPWDKRWQPRFSYGIIAIESEKIEARHVFFDSRD
ncbi:metallophosphoesterase family protein [Paenibacillus lutrae]|uniref:Phosphoesterase n=1 Tax=Paenibacillus lutrae TaxID=2078573 RepID=A0A7X3FMJ9_9BACL|nr:metallophosphoesterase family protein [Paenibacillus lutrae]MVP02397.1 YfcE family phosphodiesterase [Paenibacillus lutrae]